MTAPVIVFDLPRQFSPTPGHRFRSHGPHSGEELRDDVLFPLLSGHPGAVIEIHLDGAAGYAMGFLEEAFGGLARRIGAELCRRRMRFVSHHDPSLMEEIFDMIGAQDRKVRLECF